MPYGLFVETGINFLWMYLKIFDFGLVVLIWMVQLVVYPSFQYYDKASLMRWHGPYTQNITYIVMPLMLGQLVLHGMGLINDFHWIRLVALTMVVATWAITFFTSVPLHNKIGLGVEVAESVQALIRSNWLRTILWTLIFLVSWFLFPESQARTD